MVADTGRVWRCAVCGYIHRQPEPPECCPVCGTPRSGFEPFVEEGVSVPKVPVQRWRCVNCTYIHTGPQPPEYCPVCHAPSDRMEGIQGAAEEISRSGAGSKVVIVGVGIAGISAAEAIREASGQAEITLISKEPALPYYRLNLTRYLAGEIGLENLPIHPEEWYREKNIQLLKGMEVSRVLPEEQTVALHGGEKIPFEKLILTVGSHPFLPPFPGAYKEGVTTFRTVNDARQILETARPGSKCVCIGGGILGLETAGALARRGVEVTLVEGYGWLLPRQLTERAAKFLERRVKEMGIKLLVNAQTGEIVGDERVAGVQLKDGRVLPADVVVVSTGVRPNSYLARLAGLEVNQGIIVNNCLFSSNPSILAAGDVAEHRGVLYGIWAPSQYQGNIAGLNAVGISAEFGGIPKSNTLKVLGFDLFSIGKLEPDDASFTVIEQEMDDQFYRFVFRDTHLVGAILLGNTELSIAVNTAVTRKTDFSGLLGGQPDVKAVMDHLR